MMVDTTQGMLPVLLKAVILQAIKAGASDIHFKANAVPTFRVGGKLVPAQVSVLTSEVLKGYLFSLLTPQQKDLFESRLELDVGLALSEGVRVRLNLYMDVDTVGGAMRLIPHEAPTLTDLGAPPVVEKLVSMQSGLIIVSGVTGAGKTTLLAGMIESINRREAKHIYTIEDPIEFIFQGKRSIFTQREVGLSTLDFAAAVRSSLRADPDVVMLGEMRDRQTVTAALEAAETGLLVLTTLHTKSAVKAVQRILSMFQPGEKEAIQVQLAAALQAVVCQQLLPLGEGGRRPVHEILIATAAVREAMASGEFEKIQEYMRNGAYDGMQVMDDTIYQMYAEGLIEPSVAIAAAVNPDEMARTLRGAS